MGQPKNSKDLLPLVYTQLRELAESRLRHEKKAQTLQPTALVHEAYLRIHKGTDSSWESRGHFFSAAAIAMRRILIEKARERAQLKRGGEFQRITLSALEPADSQKELDVLDLEEALNKLEAYDARKAQVVNLRYFAGLSLEEVAQALDLSLATVKNDWSFARAWLYQKLSPEEKS